MRRRSPLKDRQVLQSFSSYPKISSKIAKKEDLKESKEGMSLRTTQPRNYLTMQIEEKELDFEDN